MPVKKTSALALACAAVAAALLATGSPAAERQPCEAPANGLNLCLVDVKPASVVPAGTKVKIEVEVATNADVNSGSLFADAVSATSSQTLIDNAPFALKAGGVKKFKVKLVVPSGTTEVDFIASSELEFPYGHSTLVVLLTGT